MNDTETPPPAAPPAADTAAEDAAAAGATPARAREDAEAVTREANPQLSDAEVARIADGVMERMDKRGLFDEPETPPPAPETPAEGSAEGSGEAAPNPANEDAPKKRTPAARFMGHN